MPLPKIKASGAADAMKLDDGSESLDTYIRQAIGKEPFHSFSRANDSPVQWIQLLHALDQQADLPGWPLLTPSKVQMQKCDKCSREFCSTINYRRHMRLHRRNLNLDKDSTMKNRGLLQAFWDKLCPEEAMEVMSFNNVSLEGVSGSSIVKELASFIRKPGFLSLPQNYVKAGSALLDIVQGRPSRFPISSQELFNILDDASEKTFLFAGTAESLQKYVFDGEAGKIGLEMRNLVACISFLVEQKLVKACLADKDAEALRYQKLLVEEEEAAQKRQAALLEKKRQKKLRQKEQRAKEQATAETDDSPEDSSTSPTSSHVDTPDSILEVPEVLHNTTLSSEPVQIIYVEADIDKSHENEYPDFDTSLNVYPDLGTYQNFDHRTLHRSSRRYTANSRWQAPKLQRAPNGFHTSHNYQASKLGTIQKHASSRDSRISGVKVWTPKPKSDTDEENCRTRLQTEAPNVREQDKKHEVLIGSISVTIGNHNNMQQDDHPGRTPESSAVELSTPSENGSHERSVKTEAVQGTANPSTVKLWRPVSRHDNGAQLPIQNDVGACEVGSIPCNGSNQVQQTCEENHASADSGIQQGSRFSSHVAKVFLAKRWKEVMASDHVKLVLFTEARPPGCKGNNHNQQTVPSSKVGQRGILHNAENRLESYTNLEHLTAVKAKTRAKAEKGIKVKYIPKQRS
ncbi:Zinc finger and BTB domain-containing protein 17, partial [Bienertia sinuspersici]